MMLCVMVLGIRAYLQRYMYVCMFSYSRFWSLDSCEEDGQTMHQCLTAPLEITSFGWKTPQIPSGSLRYSQTRVTTYQLRLIIKIIKQVIKSEDDKGRRHERVSGNVLVATLPQTRPETDMQAMSNDV